MRLICALIFAGAFCVFTWTVSAWADFDVSPRVVGGQITTYGFDDELPPETALTLDVHRVFDFGFDDPLSPNFTQDPGFHALATTSGFIPSGLPNGSKLFFDVLSDLQFWNGATFEPVPAGETYLLELGSSHTTPNPIGTGPGFYAGFQIGTVGSDGDQGLHVHLGSTLQTGSQPDPTDGVYLLELQLRLLSSDGVTPYPGIANSLPFFALFDHGSAEGAIDDAHAYVQNNLVPEPAAGVLAGWAGLASLGACWRRRRITRRSKP